MSSRKQKLERKPCGKCFFRRSRESFLLNLNTIQNKTYLKLKWPKAATNREYVENSCKSCPHLPAPVAWKGFVFRRRSQQVSFSWRGRDFFAGQTHRTRHFNLLWAFHDNEGAFYLQVGCILALWILSADELAQNWAKNACLWQVRKKTPPLITMYPKFANTSIFRLSGFGSGRS